MFAISFDLEIAELKMSYSDPYNNAYFEISREIKAYGFERTQGGVYLSTSTENSLAIVYKVINALSSIKWFKASVRDIRVFKVEDWSDFTDIVKNS